MAQMTRRLGSAKRNGGVQMRLMCVNEFPRDHLLAASLGVRHWGSAVARWMKWSREMKITGSTQFSAPEKLYPFRKGWMRRWFFSPPPNTHGRLCVYARVSRRRRWTALLLNFMWDCVCVKSACEVAHTPWAEGPESKSFARRMDGVCVECVWFERHDDCFVNDEGCTRCVSIEPPATATHSEKKNRWTQKSRPLHAHTHIIMMRDYSEPRTRNINNQCGIYVYIHTQYICHT